MINQKYKLTLKKVGGSVYCLIPSGLVSELDIKDDLEILASLEKYGDIIRDMINKYHKSGETIIVFCGDLELEGEIAFVDKLSITFFSGEKHYVLPIKLITELKPKEEQK